MTTKTMCGPSCKCSKHTDTPRTDAEIWDVVYHHKNEIVVDADFARELERELAASKAEVERLTEQLESTKHLAVKFWKVLEENGFKMELPK